MKNISAYDLHYRMASIFTRNLAYKNGRKTIKHILRKSQASTTASREMPEESENSSHPKQVSHQRTKPKSATIQLLQKTAEILEYDGTKQKQTFEAEYLKKKMLVDDPRFGKEALAWIQ
ncbi:uncharacterized protein LOC128290525 [Gossypium arboreum]|uniref:uncharacterized protein LOC128290525 n=1 Tax=Gossypium arboreum TaxID=29729 RepID=UPI0022F18784|nr:uncharacterized protein LOC128290525 [Gossypium arboreum]